MKAVYLMLAFLLVSPAFGQTKTDPAPAGPTQPAKPIPAISSELKLQIRDVQRDMDKIEQQNNQIQTYLNGLKTQYEIAQKNLQTLEDKAFAEAKLDKTKYDIDVDKLSFVSKPVPSAESPVHGIK